MSSTMNRPLLINDTLLVIPDQQLVKRGDKELSLDPKVYALLSYFIQHAGRILSRDELLDNVWAGVVVSDNSVSWSISQLRKALGDEAANPQYIKTLPKRGYQFIASVQETGGPVPESPHPVPVLPTPLPSTHTAPLSHRRSARDRLIGVMIGVILVMGILAGLTLSPETPEDYHLGEAASVTHLPGLEDGAALSPDGLFLVFRHKDIARADGYQLYLKPLRDTQTLPETLISGELSGKRIESHRDLNAFRLSSDAFNYRDVIWGKDNFQLFAVRTRDTSCEIVELILPVSRQRMVDEILIEPCHAEGWTTLAFDTTSNHLYFTDKRHTGQYQVFTRDLSGDTVTALTRSEESGLGDHFISLDLQKAKLLILRDIQGTTSHFLSLDIKTNDIEQLLEIESPYYTAYWGPAEEDIWLNWGNDQLYRYHIASQTSEKLLSSSYGWNYNARPLNKDQMIVTVSDANGGDLRTWQAGAFDSQSLADTQRLPAHNPADGTLAFISDQGGLPQIWLTQPHTTAARQLSNLDKFTYFVNLNWSPDGRWLLGNTGEQLGAIDTQQQLHRILYQGSARAYFPSWMPDGQQVIFSRQDGEDWQLYRVALAERPQPPKLLTREPGKYAVALNDNDILFSKAHQPGLFQLDIATGKTSQRQQGFPADTFWRLAGDHIYFIGRFPERGLYHTPIDTFSPTQITPLPSRVGGQFTLAPDMHTLIFEDRRRRQSTLKTAPILWN